MVTKLTPLKMVGFVMGLWFLASAFGHDLAGWIGTKMAIPKAHADGTAFSLVESLPIYMNGCKNIMIVSLIFGCCFLLFSPIVKKRMHDVN
jgi:POT family proton-dependent oligopeptide transporter